MLTVVTDVDRPNWIGDAHSIAGVMIRLSIYNAYRDCFQFSAMRNSHEINAASKTKRICQNKF